jgi:predicted nucleotidyltransferase
MSKNRELKSNIKSILNKYKTVLQEINFPVKTLILYGSYAQGNSTENSDIDVCVISDKFNENRDHYEDLLWKKVVEVDSRIEPVGYSPENFNQNDPLVSEIIKNGVEI